MQKQRKAVKQDQIIVESLNEVKDIYFLLKGYK